MSKQNVTGRSYRLAFICVWSSASCIDALRRRWDATDGHSSSDDVIGDVVAARDGISPADEVELNVNTDLSLKPTLSGDVMKLLTMQ